MRNIPFLRSFCDYLDTVPDDKLRIDVLISHDGTACLSGHLTKFYIDQLKIEGHPAHHFDDSLKYAGIELKYGMDCIRIGLAVDLFTPPNYRLNGPEYRPSQMRKVMRHFTETGKVDWSVK